MNGLIWIGLKGARIGLLWAAMLLVACSSAPPRGLDDGVVRAPAGPRYSGEAPNRLRQHYQSWQGTPYRLGGLSRGGIDCSGFVFVTYRDVYGLLLPRSTDALADLGEEVDLEDARVGDVLIFKTGFTQKHAGIYLGGDRFMHASTSSGVITSRLSSPYWRDAYRETRRVRR